MTEQEFDEEDAGGQQAVPLTPISGEFPVEVWLNLQTQIAEPFIVIPVENGRIKSVRLVIEYSGGGNN